MFFQMVKLSAFVFTWITYELTILFQKIKISRIDMVEAMKENNRDE